MKLEDLAKSGGFGILPAVALKNPDALRPLGILGNLAADKLEDREEKKRREEMEGKAPGMKKGGKVKKMKSGGYVKSADGCAQRGKTRGKFV